MKSGEHMRILIIEDEYLVAEEIRQCLKRAGFAEVQNAATEDEALKCIANGGWDAVVADANLNGRRIDVVADVLLKRGIPLVLVTGYGRASLPERFRDVTVVEKPFRAKTLVEAVSGLFTKKITDTLGESGKA